jgi:hypothetical protein
MVFTFDCNLVVPASVTFPVIVVITCIVASVGCFAVLRRGARRRVVLTDVAHPSPLPDTVLDTSSPEQREVFQAFANEMVGEFQHFCASSCPSGSTITDATSDIDDIDNEETPEETQLPPTQLPPMGRMHMRAKEDVRFTKNRKNRSWHLGNACGHLRGIPDSQIERQVFYEFPSKVCQDCMKRLRVGKCLDLCTCLECTAKRAK